MKLELDFHPKRVIAFVVMAFLAVWPWMPFAPFSVLGDSINAAEYAIVAISLVVLIGWVGQISIAHAALVGVGAYTTALIVNHLSVPFPANLPLAAACSAIVAALLGAVALRVRGLYLAVATLIFGYMADEFLFHQTWFTGFGGEASITNTFIGHHGAFPSFDFNDRRIFYYVAWACALAVLYAAANLRSAKTGRAFFAVRGSEVAAASLGINVTRYKLLAFTISGAFAGIAGCLTMVGQQAVGSDQFNLNQSIFFLSIAVVGGLTSLGGAIVASMLFAGLSEAFLRIHALNGYLDVTSALLLAVVLLAYPGGLGAIPELVGRIRRRSGEMLDQANRRLQLQRVLRRMGSDEEPAADVDATPTVPTIPVAAEPPAPRSKPLAGLRRLAGVVQLRRPMEVPGPLFPTLAVAPAGASAAASAGVAAPSGTDVAGGTAETPAEDEPVAQVLSITSFRRSPIDLAPNREDRAPMIEASGITVRFGGLVANDNVSFVVREREIVGLIGPNGAGKTTLFNAVAGLNQPAGGTVHLMGHDVTKWGVHERAKVGVARTFQAIQLFGQLTVFENLMVATHLQNPTGVISHVFGGERSIIADLAARDRVLQVLDLLELRSIADRTVRGLPFGTLRMIEVARAIVTGARIIMLDEPASGLDNTETERLADLLRYLRGALGMTLLVIEHDVPFVTGVSDYMYVIDRGKLLADGTPGEIQRNPAVVAAYLGQVAEDADTRDAIELA